MKYQNDSMGRTLQELARSAVIDLSGCARSKAATGSRPNAYVFDARSDRQASPDRQRPADSGIRGADPMDARG